MTNHEVTAISGQAEYNAPKLTLVGSFEQVTQGKGTGAYLDAFFPAHTPKGKLTFS